MTFRRIEVRNPILTQFERDKLEDKLCRYVIGAMGAWGIGFFSVVSIMHWTGSAVV